MDNKFLSTCVLIAENGEIFESGLYTTRHNEAVKECASYINYEVNEYQSLKDIFNLVVSETNSILLLNMGLMDDGKGNKGKTGYLALPEELSKEQVEKSDILIEVLSSYYHLSVCKMENGKLKDRYDTTAVDLFKKMVEEKGTVR